MLEVLVLFVTSKYVDDCILFTPSREEIHIDSLIDCLKQGTGSPRIEYQLVLLNVEGDDYAGFLGINIGVSTGIEGALELLQTGG